MVIQVILILVVIIFIAYSLGVGGEIIDDAVASVRENVVKQKDVVDPAIFEVANFAADTGTRICDLELKFYGAMTPYNPSTLENVPLIFTDEIWIWHGTINSDIDIFADLFGLTIADDTRIVTYEWFCPTVNVSAASIFWNLRQNILELFPDRGSVSELNLAGLDILSSVTEGFAAIATQTLDAKTDGEVIRLFFQAESLNTGKLMIDKNAFGLDNKPFQAAVKLPFGSATPYNYIIKIRLQDVTEDSYELQFWSNNLVQNNKNVGFVFTYDICSPTSLATNTIGTVVGKTIFGETFIVDLASESIKKQGC